MAFSRRHQKLPGSPTRTKARYQPRPQPPAAPQLSPRGLRHDERHLGTHSDVTRPEITAHTADHIPAILYSDKSKICYSFVIAPSSGQPLNVTAPSVAGCNIVVTLMPSSGCFVKSKDVWLKLCSMCANWFITCYYNCCD